MFGPILGSVILRNSFIPDMARVSCTSNGPQNDVDSFSGLYVDRLSHGQHSLPGNYIRIEIDMTSALNGYQASLRSVDHGSYLPLSHCFSTAATKHAPKHSREGRRK